MFTIGTTKAPKKKPSGTATVKAALLKVASGEAKVGPKGVSIHLAGLDGLRVKAEKATKGEMKGTLDRIWWNARWACRKADDPLYAAFEATGGMALTNKGEKGYLVLSAEKAAEVQAAFAKANK